MNPPPLAVFVVDDDPLTRKLMTRMLTRIGTTVFTAENGQQALDELCGVGSYVSNAPYSLALTPTHSTARSHGERGSAEEGETSAPQGRKFDVGEWVGAPGASGDEEVGI